MSLTFPRFQISRRGFGALRLPRAEITSGPAKRRPVWSAGATAAWAGAARRPSRHRPDGGTAAAPGFTAAGPRVTEGEQTP